MQKCYACENATVAILIQMQKSRVSLARYGGNAGT
jgi:hypothetical protein